MNSLSVSERLSVLEKNIDALTNLTTQQRAPKSVNHNGGQGNSSYNYKEQVHQLSDKEGIYALLEENKRECNLGFQNLKEEIQEPLVVRRKRINLLLRKSYQWKRDNRESTIQ